MSKLCHSITALSVAWWISNCLGPAAPIWALPATTLPFFGSASAAPATMTPIRAQAGSAALRLRQVGTFTAPPYCWPQAAQPPGTALVVLVGDQTALGEGDDLEAGC